MNLFRTPLHRPAHPPSSLLRLLLSHRPCCRLRGKRINLLSRHLLPLSPAARPAQGEAANNSLHCSPRAAQETLRAEGHRRVSFRPVQVRPHGLHPLSPREDTRCRSLDDFAGRCRFQGRRIRAHWPEVVGLGRSKCTSSCLGGSHSALCPFPCADVSASVLCGRDHRTYRNDAETPTFRY